MGGVGHHELGVERARLARGGGGTLRLRPGVNLRPLSHNSQRGDWQKNSEMEVDSSGGMSRGDVRRIQSIVSLPVHHIQACTGGANSLTQNPPHSGEIPQIVYLFASGAGMDN